MKEAVIAFQLLFYLIYQSTKWSKKKYASNDHTAVVIWLMLAFVLVLDAGLKLSILKCLRGAVDDVSSRHPAPSDTTTR